MKFSAGRKKYDSYEWPIVKKKKNKWKNKQSEDGYGEYREKDIDILRMYLCKSYGYEELENINEDDFKIGNRNKYI